MLGLSGRPPSEPHKSLLPQESGPGSLPNVNPNQSGGAGARWPATGERAGDSPGEPERAEGETDSPSGPPRGLSSPAAGGSSERSPGPTQTHRDAVAEHTGTRGRTESPAPAAKCLMGLTAQVGLSSGSFSTGAGTKARAAEAPRRPQSRAQTPAEDEHAW